MVPIIYRVVVNEISPFQALLKKGAIPELGARAFGIRGRMSLYPGGLQNRDKIIGWSQDNPIKRHATP